jgi:hypothetical protein
LSIFERLDALLKTPSPRWASVPARRSDGREAVTSTPLFGEVRDEVGLTGKQ